MLLYRMVWTYPGFVDTGLFGFEESTATPFVITLALRGGGLLAAELRTSSAHRDDVARRLPKPGARGVGVLFAYLVTGGLAMCASSRGGFYATCDDRTKGR